LSCTDRGIDMDTHGKRNIKAKPMASLRRTDMNKPFRRTIASMKRRSSVIMSTVVMNCHLLNCFQP
jgi:hypothetical protein